MPKFEIKNRWTGEPICAGEVESFKVLIEAAIKSGANLASANLEGANLWDANLWGANLRDANLWGANLEDANLRGANLASANLASANLRGANLASANLRGANLLDANLWGADLWGANLAGANLEGANLWGYFSFGPGGSRQSYTWARWEKEGYMVHCGCKTLTLKDFKAEVKKTHKNNTYAKYYLANIKTMEIVAKMSEKAYREAGKKEGK